MEMPVTEEVRGFCVSWVLWKQTLETNCHAEGFAQGHLDDSFKELWGKQTLEQVEKLTVDAGACPRPQPVPSDSETGLPFHSHP